MDAGSGPPAAASSAGDALIVIDSWRVVHGRVLAFDRHRSRFEAAVAACFGGSAPAGAPQDRRVLPDRGAWGAFWDRVRNGTPRAGEWFPRVTARLVRMLVPGEHVVRPCVELGFELRPAPPRRLETRLVTVPDERIMPLVKGADLTWCGQARERAVAAGADDALLVADDGELILEAAHGAVIGWRDGTCVLPPPPGPDGRALASVTVSVLSGLLPKLGVPVERGSLRLRQIAGDAGASGGIEAIWYVNALHGVSPVTLLDGRPVMTAEPALVRTVQRAIEARRVPL